MLCEGFIKAAADAFLLGAIMTSLPNGSAFAQSQAERDLIVSAEKGELVAVRQLLQ